MSKIDAVVTGQLAHPLALAGIPVHEVSGAKEAETVVSELLAKGGEVLIVQDTLREGFSEWFRARLAHHRGNPLLVNCPAFTQEDSNADAYIASILKPAIGYEIRLE